MQKGIAFLWVASLQPSPSLSYPVCIRAPMADRPQQATVPDSGNRLSNPSPNPKETKTSSTPYEPVCPNNYITTGQPVKRELHLLPQKSLGEAQTTRYSVTDIQSARDVHTPPKAALKSHNVDTKCPDVYIAVENLEAALPIDLNEDSKSSKGSYVLTPTPTMPALPGTSPLSSKRRSSSAQRVSSQRYADIFGSKRLWLTPQGSLELPSTSPFNHRTYDKFRTKSGRYDRYELQYKILFSDASPLWWQVVNPILAKWILRERHGQTDDGDLWTSTICSEICCLLKWGIDQFARLQSTYGKLWSNRPDPQTNPGRPERPGIEESAGDDDGDGDGEENNDVNPDRYFDALQGPELDELKVSGFVALILYMMKFGMKKATEI